MCHTFEKRHVCMLKQADYFTNFYVSKKNEIPVSVYMYYFLSSVTERAECTNDIFCPTCLYSGPCSQISLGCTAIMTFKLLSKFYIFYS